MAEHKQNISSNVDAIMDIAGALSKIFKKYSKETRKQAWKSITNPDGETEVQKIIRNPDMSINRFRTIKRKTFLEWME